jgi:hypothetical protein
MPPQQPPPPVENERSRRKRKFREYVKEEAPGLEVEVGVDQVRLRFCDWWWAGEMLTNRSCPTT